LTSGDINGYNLYAYCLNNPVINIDPIGCFPILIAALFGVFLVVVASLGGQIGYDNAVRAGKTGSDLFWSTVGWAVIGAGAGIATAGALLLLSAGIYGLISGGLAVHFLGVTALQAVAIGALAFNIFAYAFAPILGIEMDGIEIGGGEKPKVPKPGPTPKHPSEKK
jgi:hypothetical protein